MQCNLNDATSRHAGWLISQRKGGVGIFYGLEQRKKERIVSWICANMIPLLAISVVVWRLEDPFMRTYPSIHPHRPYKRFHIGMNGSYLQ
jgi:hypothetical protein